MAKGSLSNIRIVHSSLTDTIYLCRFGKDPALALEKRKAEGDVMTALVDHMMHGAPRGSKKHVRIDGEWFTVTVEPMKGDTNGTDE